MSNLLVPIATIENIRPHPNADNLLLCDVLGWQLVIGKDNGYEEGQRIVYVPPDSILPQDLSDTLNVTKYLSKQRVRATKLRGEPSYGVTVPISMLPPSLQGESIGTNVADIFGITKYEPPVRMDGGDIISAPDAFFKYTEIENLRHYPDSFQENELVVITEKLHGTNSRVGHINGSVMVGSRTFRREHNSDKRGLYSFPLECTGVSQLIQSYDNIILFGEIFGSEVQNLNYGCIGNLGYRAFDVMIDGRYMNYRDFVNLMSQFSIPRVPELYIGPFSLDIVRFFASGNTNLNASHMMEGVVVKPLVERYEPEVGRLILKYLSDEYLTGKHTDFTDK